MVRCKCTVAKSIESGSNYSSFCGSSVDSEGSVYAAGFIQGSSIFNFGNSITVAGKSDYENILIVKYNSSGVAQWARTVSSVSFNYF
jgi:hypothetical protein